MWMFPWSLFFDTDNLRSYEKKDNNMELGLTDGNEMTDNPYVQLGAPSRSEEEKRSLGAGRYAVEKGNEVRGAIQAEARAPDMATMTTGTGSAASVPKSDVSSMPFTPTEYKIRVNFTPENLKQKGMKEYALVVPLSKVIPARWRDERDEHGATDASRIGEIILSGFDTNYWNPVSGRFRILDKRRTISSSGMDTFSDRLGADGVIKGSKDKVQFTITQSPKTTDTRVLLRPGANEDEGLSFLEREGYGAVTEEQLWDMVEMPPGKKHDRSVLERVAHVNTPIAKHLLQNIIKQGLTPQYQDGDKQQVLLMQHADAERTIQHMMLERFRTLTLGEMVDNGSLHFYVTHADIDALASSNNDYASPWADPGSEIRSIRDLRVQEDETAAKLQTECYIDLTMTVGVQPTV